MNTSQEHDNKELHEIDNLTGFFSVLFLIDKKIEKEREVSVEQTPDVVGGTS